jgi:hypothetical protein
VAEIRLLLYNQTKCPDNTQYMSLVVEECDRFALMRALSLLKRRNPGVSWRWCGERNTSRSPPSIRQ